MDIVSVPFVINGAMDTMIVRTRLLAVLLHDVNQEPGHVVRLKDGLSSIGDGSDKKCANFLGSKLPRSGRG
jgi:hypothetical protein